MVIGATGIIESHLLGTLMTVLFVVIFIYNRNISKENFLLDLLYIRDFMCNISMSIKFVFT